VHDAAKLNIFLASQMPRLANQISRSVPAFCLVIEVNQVEFSRLKQVIARHVYTKEDGE